MNEKFANVPMDSDTLLLLQADAQINGIDALYQKWIWSGVAADSLIFANADVADIDETALKNLVAESAFAINKDIEQMTYNVSKSGFTFVNFNFEAKD